jgi:hypothetical protein
MKAEIHSISLSLPLKTIIAKIAAPYANQLRLLQWS